VSPSYILLQRMPHFYPECWARRIFDSERKTAAYASIVPPASHNHTGWAEGRMRSARSLRLLHFAAALVSQVRSGGTHRRGWLSEH
jgi:hypothetical protein